MSRLKNGDERTDKKKAANTEETHERETRQLKEYGNIKIIGDHRWHKKVLE